ncbi:MAG: thiamine biosynthesis protein ThiF [Bacteroidetes bacterium HGW-Bacteroidetes-4]|jgi:sulfur carrier protein ThiS adenylyltransferase|nr:MAG: thiamine biosynthesis protein ThiF [Bacteroidetes bacterium HGW-Bacteroidetes-4]
MNTKQIAERLAGFTVGIAGAGGLGSNCAVALVRCGLKNLVVADFDVVQPGNLNRQYYFLDQLGMKKVAALELNLNRIVKGLHLQMVDKKLVPADIINLFKHCDVIVEAFDDKAQKQMLIETVLGNFPDKPLIIGSGMAGWGANNMLVTRQFDKIYVCGDQESEIADNLPPLGPRVGIVANMQANQVMEILLGKMNCDDY